MNQYGFIIRLFYLKYESDCCPDFMSWRWTLGRREGFEQEGAVTVVHSNYNQLTAVHRKDDALQ